MKVIDQNLPPLPLGESNFTCLRSAGEIYVDKTKLIHELAMRESQILLTRPRRFGKSLLTSTFFSLFKFGLRDFRELEIENLWTDNGKYKVLSLDLSPLSDFKSAADFDQRFNSYLFRFLKENQILEKEYETEPNAIREFYWWLYKQPERSLVLLIDEYDAPLTSCLTNQEAFREVRRIMASFYSCLKSCNSAFRFVFLTGITKFCNVGIFSELNAFHDISLDRRYSTIVGYTVEELQKYFREYLHKAAKLLDIPESQLVEELVLHYGGFCFDELGEKKVCSPWSILTFFKEPQRGYRNYWFATGGQFTQLLKQLNDNFPNSFFQYAKGMPIRTDMLSTSIVSGEINETVLLFRTGYLTIKENVGYDILCLGYPNKEIAYSMAMLDLNKELKKPTVISGEEVGIPSLLGIGDAKDFVQHVNKAFLGLPYEQRSFIEDEKNCQGAFLLVLYGAGLIKEIKTHTAAGRDDIEMKVSGMRWSVEVKYACKKKEIQKLLKVARKQQKSTNDLERSISKNLVSLVLVYSAKKRYFVKYEVIR